MIQYFTSEAAAPEPSSSSDAARGGGAEMTLRGVPPRFVRRIPLPGVRAVTAPPRGTPLDLEGVKVHLGSSTGEGARGERGAAEAGGGEEGISVSLLAWGIRGGVDGGGRRVSMRLGAWLHRFDRGHGRAFSHVCVDAGAGKKRSITLQFACACFCAMCLGRYPRCIIRRYMQNKVGGPRARLVTGQTCEL